MCMHEQAAAEQIAQAPNEPCANFAKTFADCMSDNNGDLEGCRYYFDKLQVLEFPTSKVAVVLGWSLNVWRGLNSKSTVICMASQKVHRRTRCGVKEVDDENANAAGLPTGVFVGGAKFFSVPCPKQQAGG